MTVFTKNEIEKTFIKMLNEKELSEISVNDIAAACEINRNTFYYHYSSISDLIESIIKKTVDNSIKKFPSTDSFEECLIFAISTASENKRAIRHIYDSASRPIFERHLWELCDYAVDNYLKSNSKSKKFEPEELEVIKGFFKNECFGFTISWINEGMPSDVIKKIKQLGVLKKISKILK